MDMLDNKEEWRSIQQIIIYVYDFLSK